MGTTTTRAKSSAIPCVQSNVHISIHAPLARCDTWNLAEKMRCMHFNPRTSCEVRQDFGNSVLSMIAFQSTHLLRGATCDGQHRQASRHDFNPRTSCEVRRRRTLLQGIHKAFQSTHLLRGATLRQPAFRQARPISIHAPLARCDFPHLSRYNGTMDFNPRTSCEVRRGDM